MPDGSTALYFEHDAFVAFDLFLLERPDASQDYDTATIERATKKFNSLTEVQKETLFKNALLGLPGSDVPFTKEEVLTALRTYDGISREQLKEHLYLFLEEIIPIAESLHLKMAIHPDDPPFSVLGLPRIMGTAADAQDLIARIPSKVNGFCFCTGSFGARADNNIPAMLDALGDHIHFLHLRNTKRDAAGNFYEADHLYGDTDMVTVIRKCIEIQKRRGISLPMRPDHGHQMLDDLNKKTYPGYSAIGRLKGLAELRGVEFALLHQS
jgi:mannonate dehydratase